MKRFRYFRAVFSVGAMAAFLSLAPIAIQPAQAQRVLVHGADPGPTFGADGNLFAYLQSLLGPDNVTYMQGDMAAGDGSSANGFDAVIVSSTLGSGTVRGKYADTPIPLMNWEQAITRQAVGEFNLSVGGGTATGQTEINIVDSNHPIAAGLSGTVQVFKTAQTMSFGTGALGGGVSLVGSLTSNTDNHGIMAADTGGALLGDGSAGSPATAPARRVMFFLEDAGFDDLTVPGLRLFNNALQYTLDAAEPFPVLRAIGDADGVPDREKISGQFQNETFLAPQTIDGVVRYEVFQFNLGDRTRNGFETSAAANEPTYEGLMAGPFVWDDPNTYPAEWQSFFPNGVNQDNYHVAIRGQMFVTDVGDDGTEIVDFRDGNDDYALLVVDEFGDGDLEFGTTIIDDNSHTNLATTGNGGQAPGSGPGNAFFTNLSGGGEWRDFLFVHAEGGGGDNASLYWSNNDGAPAFPIDSTVAVDQAAHRIPASALRVAGEEVIDTADFVADLSGGLTVVFDVVVDELEWDKVALGDHPPILGNPDVQINGIITFEGSTIRVDLDKDPLPGMTIDIVDNRGVNEIIGPAEFVFSHGDPSLWDFSQFAVNGQLTFGGAPQGIVGDYNNNGQVEQGDLDLVLLNWGTALGEPWVTGNVDQAELDGVLLNWGNIAALGSTAGVPEPSAIALLLIAAGLGLGLTRKR